MDAKIKKLDYIFNPKSVAIIGASVTSNTIGNIVLKNFLDSRYPGKIYPINPKYKEIHGLQCYSSVTAVKGKIDCAIIVTPAKIVPIVLKDCAKKKVGGVVLITSGFEEVGEFELAKQIKKIADDAKMPLIGPNCLGVLNPHTRVDSIFLPIYKL